MNENSSRNHPRGLSSKPLSRRRVLAGGAMAVAGTAAGLVGCGGGDDDGAPTAPVRDATPGTRTAAAPQKGGIYRDARSIDAWDTFDVDRSRFTPLMTLLGYTNEGLIHYRSFARAELEGAFAKSWEQPTPDTLNLTLQDNLFWHDKPPVNGRAATVDDIVHFIERNKAAKLRDGTPDKEFYRASEFAAVDSVSAVDARTVSIRFRRPYPLFQLTLAAGGSKVQAPEAVDTFEAEYTSPRAEQIIGTGAFVLTSFDPSGNFEMERFDRYHRESWMDGVKWTNLFTDAAALQAAFEEKRTELFAPRTPVIVEALKKRYEGQLQHFRTFGTNPMLSAHYAGSPPWSDEQLFGAIFRAIDRRRLIDELNQGEAVLAGNVPPAQEQFAIPETELITMPGYLEDHAVDAAEARKMWEAAGGPDIGRTLVDIPDIAEGALPGFTDLMLGMLRGTLGDFFDAQVVPYTTINDKLNKQQYGNGNNAVWFGWGSDVAKLEPALDLWNVYNSRSPLFPYIGGKKVDAVDSLTDQVVNEFDLEARKNLCQEVNRELLRHYGAGIAYLINGMNNTLMWNYYHVGEVAPFGNSHQCATQCWFDQNDPTWQGRPA